MVPESNLRARYTEYKGSRENLEEIVTKKNIHNVKTVRNYYSFRRSLIKVIRLYQHNAIN